MDQDERLFACIVTGMMDRVPATHWAMGQAGMILLAAACSGIGPENDGDEEEAIAARIHHAAYEQGRDEGHKQGVAHCLTYLEKKPMERQPVAA
jgi:hypothetical protein